MNQLMTTNDDSQRGLQPAPFGMQQQHEAPENPHSPLRRLLEGAFRSKGLLIILTVLGGTVGAGLGIMKPNEYGSKATFLFRAGSENVTVKPSDDLPREWGRMGSVAENAPHLLKSPELARRTVQRLGVAKLFQPFRPDTKDSSFLREVVRDLQGTIHDSNPQKRNVSEAVDKFLGGLAIIPFRHASLLTVTFAANEPRLAQDILKSYCEEAVKYHIEIYNDPTAIRLVEANLETAKAAFERAKVAHSKLLAATGMSNFELQFGLMQDECSAARRELRAMEEVEIPSLKTGITKIRKTLSTMQPRTSEEVSVPVPNLLVISYGEKIVSAQEELLEAKSRFKSDTAPEVINLKRRVDALVAAQKIERERPLQVVPQVKVVENLEYSGLKARLDEMEIKFAVATGNLEPKREWVKAKEKQIDELTKVAGQYATIAADKEDARARFQQAQLAMSQAHSKQRLAANEMSVLNLVEPPSFQPNRVGPKRGQMALLGLLGGLGLGLGLVGVRSLTDKTVRSPEELEQLIGLRVLATVPDLRAKHVRRHENRILSGC